MLYYTSERIDDRQKPVTCHELDLVPELRTSPCCTKIRTRWQRY